MRFPQLSYCAPLLIFVALIVSVSYAGKTFVKPVAKPAINYPAHDFHRDEQVAMAADPYETPDKEKIFSVNFEEHGFLPVFFVVTNDSGQPVSLANMEITLITGNHSKLTPISGEDLYRRLSNPQAQTRPSPIPIPLPKKKPIDKKALDDIEAARFAARAVEPHGTQSGFLFFDIGGIDKPLAGANMDITGVNDAKGNELLYFEISMDKYLNAASNP
jgi:hypothetical protein